MGYLYSGATILARSGVETLVGVPEGGVGEDGAGVGVGFGTVGGVSGIEFPRFES